VTNVGSATNIVAMHCLR